MNAQFREFVESLEPKFRRLIEMHPVTYQSLPKQIPKKGIYLFSEGATHLYVGRTNRMRERLRGHCIPSATHYTATLAFRMARKQTGFMKATYKSKGSRSALEKDSIFGPAFRAAKGRIATMDIRYVEESDPVAQALLEIYVATVLGTPYNDFDTH